jgi:hypothetical protein
VNVGEGRSSFAVDIIFVAGVPMILDGLYDAF